MNFLMTILQNQETNSLQEDIDLINNKLKKIQVNMSNLRERYPCLDLYQHIEYLICLNPERKGIDEINKSVWIQVTEKIVQFVKFGAGFVSIAGAKKNISNVSLSDLNKLINELKDIWDKLYTDKSKEAYNQSLEYYSDYNKDNLQKKIKAFWIAKMKKVLDQTQKQPEINLQFKEIIFFIVVKKQLKIDANNDTIIFAYLQLNYLLSNLIKEEEMLMKFKQYLSDDKKKYLLNLKKISNQSKFRKVFQVTFKLQLVQQQKLIYLDTQRLSCFQISLQLKNILKIKNNKEKYEKSVFKLPLRKIRVGVSKYEEKRYIQVSMSRIALDLID
ncbi:hypothetical protein ABPG72_014618 [Tetrahymena utriculariae]